MNARDPEVLEQRAAELRQQYDAAVECLPYDVSQADAVKAAFAGIFQRHRRLDVLVNNAGILREGLLGMIPRDLIEDTVQTNIVGPLLHLQEAARLMGRKQSGSIINMSSIMGRYGSKGLTVYAASKAAIIGMTVAAAKELAPKSIRVNAVAPGFIATDMSRNIPEAVFEERSGALAWAASANLRKLLKQLCFLLPMSRAM